MKTTTGEVIHRAVDGASVPDDEGWIAPAVNPFLHGCCDCGLFHSVEFRMVDQDCDVKPFPEGMRLALRFTRENVETANFRKQKAPSNEAIALMWELKGGVHDTEVAKTAFGDVPINELDRDSLLRIITLLAAGKPQESRIIRV